jgi:nicotinamide mononucleotide (NMN) deamidase PncC
MSLDTWSDMEAFGEEHGLVIAIHATPHKMVMAFAGAGAQSLAWLHGVGGSSRTMLAAVDIYSDAAMREWVGFMPARFTSRRVARAMANEAYRRAKRYVAANHAATANTGGTVTGANDPVFGLASTATIATDRAKKGDHRVAVAVRDAFGMVTYALTLEKGARDREGEEDVVSLLILHAIADACGVLERPDLPLTSHEELRVTFESSDMLAQVEAGEREMVVVREDGVIVSGARAGGSRAGARAGARTDLGDGPGAATPLPGPFAIVSGAFHPVHEGHLGLARVASERTGLPALFELPLVNAEKAPIALLEARRRAHQFAGKGSLALTRAPLFAQKAKLFPRSVFVVGVDTAERILDPRFYDGSFDRLVAALEEVEAHRCRFLVAGREGRSGVFRTLVDVHVPEAAKAVVGRVFEGLPEEAFRRDVSSTEIREGWGDEAGAG